MKRFAMTAALAGGLAVAGCATNPYNDPYYGNNNDQTRRAVTGAAIGGAAGAALGAVTGVGTTEGAVAGAVLGGVAGAVINNRQYYRDTRGHCYYVDQQGRPIYNYDVRC